MMDAFDTKLEQATKKLAWIRERLSEGRSVVLATHLKATRITKKHEGMIRLRGNALEMQRGKQWDDVTYCQLTAQ